MYGSQSNIDPALGVSTDFDFNMGDGFEQAMGMTLGDGDFGRYFQDDVSILFVSIRAVTFLFCYLNYVLTWTTGFLECDDGFCWRWQ